ncbi:sigma-70 family RNA polymerase sigma factor [Paenibacillus sp. YPG26]|uniref:RNA polymerase sigma factor n=1 Tax=Paenibacillus sp. YPG26 TaxID=2878915 RepID=UPI00320AB8ED
MVQGLVEKNEAALRQLMEQYGDELLRTAYLLLKDRQAAEEAVQDTFIEVFTKISKLRDRDKLRGWMFRIMINRCRMRQRTWSWRNLFPSSEVGEWIEDELQQGPEDQLLLEWRNGRLSEAIHQLAYIYREAITLYYYSELSIPEIAEQLNISENTIKTRLVRGRNQLRSVWEKEERQDEQET